MVLRDFTLKQAKAWVVQELPKHNTVDSILKRIESEEALEKWAASATVKFPNSRKAHENLVAALRKKLAAIVLT